MFKVPSNRASMLSLLIAFAPGCVIDEGQSSSSHESALSGQTANPVCSVSVSNYSVQPGKSFKITVTLCKPAVKPSYAGALPEASGIVGLNYGDPNPSYAQLFTTSYSIPLGQTTATSIAFGNEADLGPCWDVSSGVAYAYDYDPNVPPVVKHDSRTLTFAPYPTLKSVTVTPNPVAPNGPITVKMVLSAAAPTGGIMTYNWQFEPKGHSVGIWGNGCCADAEINIPAGSTAKSFSWNAPPGTAESGVFPAYTWYTHAATVCPPLGNFWPVLGDPATITQVINL
jgi:hypothetical protein